MQLKAIEILVGCFQD